MASRYIPTNGPVCRKPILFCLSCTIIVVLPYLFLWYYDGKAVINYVFTKEKIFSVTEIPENQTTSAWNQTTSTDNQTTSTRDDEDEPSSFLYQNEPRDDEDEVSSFLDQNEPRDNEDEPSSLLDQNEPADKELEQCDPSKALLKVFMYDMPPEFHFGLLDWNSDGNSVWPDIRNIIPDYPGGLNLQHSIEYWLTLDLLSSRFPDRGGPCSAVRVEDSHEADIVFVPFFSSVSYNRHSKIKRPEKVSKNRLLQQKLLKFLTAQEEWKRSGGIDHIIMAHHPNSMMYSRSKLWPCMFILADFGRYVPHVANVEKDVIAPYKHLIKTFVNDSSGFNDRPTLLYFQGAIYRKGGGTVRQELFYLLRHERDVHFAFGSADGNGIQEASRGMHASKFCLSVAGDTPSSNRLFDAIASHCVPVIISDEIELPFEDALDYSQFCIFVRTADALKKGFLIELIRGISQKVWTEMWHKLKEVEGYYEFQYPSEKKDAVQMIWQAVARKVPAIRRKLHKLRRFSRINSR